MLHSSYVFLIVLLSIATCFEEVLPFNVDAINQTQQSINLLSRPFITAD